MTEAQMRAEGERAVAFGLGVANVRVSETG